MLGVGEEVVERFVTFERMLPTGRMLNISSSAFCGPYASKGSGMAWSMGSRLGSDLEPIVMSIDPLLGLCERLTIWRISDHKLLMMSVLQEQPMTSNELFSISKM